MDLENISFTCTTLLGTATLFAVDYHQLEVGDIIVLNEKVDNSLSVKVDDYLQFTGAPGLL
ncbi:MAG: FliM/FliN family flagellar motor switch protein, partial [Chlamydiales bacterium]